MRQVDQQKEAMMANPHAWRGAQPRQKRYWVYVHDEDGELVSDRGEFDDLVDAISEAIDFGLQQRDPDLTARVVDNELQDGTTVWAAGPVKLITDDRGELRATI